MQLMVRKREPWQEVGKVDFNVNIKAEGRETAFLGNRVFGSIRQQKNDKARALL